MDVILNIIDDSKRQASERSAELYLNGLANKIASINLTEEFNPKSCVINNKVATCDGVEITVVDDDINITGTVWLDNGKIDGYTLNIDNQDITAGITSINCFDYTAINGQITINGYYDYENDISSNRACPTDVKIPDMIDNMPVTII